MNHGLLVATRKGLFTLRPRNGVWSIAAHAFPGVPVINVLHDPRDGGWYAALGHGHFGAKLHRSDDAGATWDEMAVPVYPPRPDDEPPTICPEGGQEIPWRLKMMWALAVDHATPGGLWCGTLPGGLFHSADRGQTWTLNRPLWDRPERRKWFGGGYDEPGIHSVLTRADAPRRVVLGISCGGTWWTEDHGLTWECRTQGMRATYVPPDQAENGEIQDPHLITGCTADPQAFWCQHHCGLFVTRDGGGRWQTIDEAGPSTFGFTVACHPADPDTAWFVPADSDEVRIPKDGRFVVTRTRDGGKTFDTLTRGLPQEHAYDLVFRHALAVDATGDTLALGSTTGNVWVSPDQGDRWTHVSAHLPPVYALRFLSSE